MQKFSRDISKWNSAIYKRITHHDRVLFLSKEYKVGLILENQFMGFTTLTKYISDNPIGSIILNGEKPTLCPLTLTTRQGCPLSPLLFNV